MEDLKKRVEKVLEKTNVAHKEKELRQIEKESMSPNFWKDQKLASSKMKQMALLSQEIDNARKLQSKLDSSDFEGVEKLLGELETQLYFSGEYDENAALVSIHSGQGGVEAMDWTQMLYRMYARYAQRKGFTLETIDEKEGDEAGLKSIIFTVEGQYAYGLLKYEAGVHRLVRQSPFNADKLRQTSFALVEVMPQIDESSEIQIKEEDLEWDFYRSGGHGGQNVNKVSTAVRLKHKPSGIVVSAQSQRHQGQNREFALKLLMGKLWVLREEEKKKKEAQLKGGYKTPGWGNQIRSYVLHPYKMVKDLRTGHETSNVSAVLDGEIDSFIEEELKAF
ncbi:MAG: peptide chain release factor 2 [Candidatus Levybacteria bacterium]|nr:peptide chain release factor 2 [Candidatus Levybacteria bacterium]